MSNTDRENLKGCFKLYCAPGEGHFAALIDGMLNQADDGIFKPKDGPLSLKAVGDAKQAQTLLNLFDHADANNPVWKFQLIPFPGQPGTVKPGFSISDGQGIPRLFIDNTGNMGIGTPSPQGKLDLAGIMTIGDDNKKPGNKTISFYTDAGDEVNAGKIIYKDESGASSLDIVGAGKTLNNRAINLFGQVKVQGNLAVNKEATLADGLRVTGNMAIQGHLGIGTGQPTGKLDIAGVLCIGPNGQQSIRFATESADDANAGTIRYKGGAAPDSGFSLYGAGSDKSRAIKLYDNVDVYGGLNVNDSVIRKVAVATEVNQPWGISEEQLKQQPQIKEVEHRKIKFTKRHSQTAIRIVYSDNLAVFGVNAYVRFIILVDGHSNSPKIVKDWYMERTNIIVSGTFNRPLTIFGYLEGLTEIKEYTIRLMIEIPTEKPSNSKYPEKVFLGVDGARWTMEAQEVFLNYGR